MRELVVQIGASVDIRNGEDTTMLVSASCVGENAMANIVNYVSTVSSK